jgi:hypothetical protein
VQGESNLRDGERQTTLGLLYVVTVAILGGEPARRIFHVESIIQDPNVQELIREREDKGRAEEARSLLEAAVTAGTLGDVFRDG